MATRRTACRAQCTLRLPAGLLIYQQARSASWRALRNDVDEWPGVKPPVRRGLYGHSKARRGPTALARAE